MPMLFREAADPQKLDLSFVNCQGGGNETHQSLIKLNYTVLPLAKNVIELGAPPPRKSVRSDFFAAIARQEAPQGRAVQLAKRYSGRRRRVTESQAGPIRIDSRG